MQIFNCQYKLKLPIAREHDYNGDYIRLLIGGLMCHAEFIVAFTI